MNKDDQIQKAWEQPTYKKFMEICIKYSLMDYEIREWHARQPRQQKVTLPDALRRNQDD